MRRRRAKLVERLAVLVMVGVLSGLLFGWWVSMTLSQPLVDAIYQGNVARVRILLDRGASPNSSGRTADHLDDEDGPTPALVLAAQYGRTDIATLLLARGANVNTRDDL